MENIIVTEELKAYIDPLTEDEYASLERSILAEGCRDALVLWGDILIDGHNRHSICTKHGLPFQTIQNTRFKSMEDVHLWMIDQHLGRRSVSDFQRGVLALRKKEIMEARRLAVLDDPTPDATAAAIEAPANASDAAVPAAPPLKSREAIARAARISSATVGQIEKIQKAAAPELVAAVKSGEVSISAAAVIAELPAEEQAAAAAGGKKELRQAAKRVRDSKVGKKAAGDAVAEAAVAVLDVPVNEDGELEQDPAVALLRAQVKALQEENVALRAQVSDLQGQLAAAKFANAG
ncbi:MAG: plasmid replication/partition related protein [Mitsuaria chitosanitabida]|uniref:plasmid replication/partition related protein n=1 Tax=Roseateles chitosanitabidus TaxID=65048 RepID=UPI001B09D95C|nr:plasmid replication/partition related protein [Roseateles chitosanitabidus]MBO9688848.1 plasmid replication/partition related protein [Roseateles chitosanitabidus]